jgi:hypothetical protein
VVRRGGRSSLGCLFTLLLVAIAVYVGVNVGEVYWRFYEFRDAMRQEVRFARQISDDKIRHHLAALVDSLGLPAEAADVNVVRSGGTISVSAEYVERVKLAVLTREFRLRPSAQGSF